MLIFKIFDLKNVLFMELDLGATFRAYGIFTLFKCIKLCHLELIYIDTLVYFNMSVRHFLCEISRLSNLYFFLLYLLLLHQLNKM